MNEKQQNVFEKMQKLEIGYDSNCAAFWREYAELEKDSRKKKQFLDLAESFEKKAKVIETRLQKMRDA